MMDRDCRNGDQAYLEYDCNDRSKKSFMALPNYTFIILIGRQSQLDIRRPKPIELRPCMAARITWQPPEAPPEAINDFQNDDVALTVII